MTTRLAPETARADPLAPGDPASPRVRRPVTLGTVRRRRMAGLAIVLLPVLWAVRRSFAGDTELVNRGGLALLVDLGATVLRPALSADFLLLAAEAALVTVVFAALGTAAALVIGAVGGLVLSDIAWPGSPPAWLRAVRMALRGILVAIRSIHEIIWALLFVSVLGLDPLVAVLAIALPFGAQTAKVFAETLDATSSAALLALRHAGVRSVPALVYGLLPGATPLLLSYAFYRFECAIRSAVLLGVVGVGGLGQELVVSLQSRNWDEVWTLIGAVLLLSALVDLWSSRVRHDMAVASCAEWSSGRGQGDRGRSPRTTRAARWSLYLLVPSLAAAWFLSGVSLGGLASERTRTLAASLLAEMWPPALPAGGLPELTGATLDTVAMAVLAMVIAVAVTLLVGPWAARPRAVGGAGAGAAGVVRVLLWGGARVLLLVLRSVPPPVWAIVALLAFYPGVLPGAVALGLYTGGILGRLVAEAWESVDRRPMDALVSAGVPRSLAGVTSLGPPSTHHMVAYTLYRFEICVRDTAVVGVVGAAGLGRLLSANLSAFNFPAVTTVLLASLAVSLASEVVGRRLRAALRP